MEAKICPECGEPIGEREGIAFGPDGIEVHARPLPCQGAAWSERSEATTERVRRAVREHHASRRLTVR